MWGNIYGVHPDDGGQQVAVNLYRKWLNGEYPQTEPEWRKEVLESLPQLRGKDLACWCKEGTPCHGDVLLEMANQ